MPRLTGGAITRLKPLFADRQALTGIQDRFYTPGGVDDELLPGFISASVCDYLSISPDPSLP